MKRTFTKTFNTVIALSLSCVAITANAQEKTISSVATPQTTLAAVAPVSKKAAATDTTKATVKNKPAAAATVAAAATATPAPEAKQTDAAWVPVRRLWGYAFGDLYWNQHADQNTGVRGPETMYNGVPANRNAFQFRRIYLGYDYEIDKRFVAEVLLASEPSANTGTITGASSNVQNGDNLVDGKMGLFIKNFNLRYRDIFTGTDLVVGEMSTPGFALNEGGTNGATSLSEATWGYRFIEKTITDFHKNNSYDLGVSLQGTFDPKTKNFGYVAMVGNNSTSSLLNATNANTGFYKQYYGDIWGKFLNKQIVVDIYADYAPTNPSTATIDQQQSHSMQKIFAAYVNPKLSVGIEAYTQQIKDGVTNTTTKTNENATVTGLSVWVKGAIIKDKMGFFARRDGYNPDTKFDAGSNYTVNTNYGSYTPNYKETFYTFGLDFTPAPKIHFSPNVWLVEYKDQRSASTTGYVGNDHNLVYRATFYYTFGK